MSEVRSDASVQSCDWRKETTRMEGTRYYLGCQASRGVATWDTIPHPRCYWCGKPVQIVNEEHIQPTRQPRRLDDRYIRMSVADLTTPESGRLCLGPRWWHVTADDHVLFFRGYTSPQCNPDRRVLEVNAIEGCTPRYIEMAFIPHRCSDYV